MNPEGSGVFLLVACFVLRILIAVPNIVLDCNASA